MIARASEIVETDASTGATSTTTSYSAEEERFYDACVEGKVDTLVEFLSGDSKNQWLHHTTKDGEHCLHLAAIKGQAAITKLLLEHGADPNIRTSFEGGLRMHPLSWNVYAGHLENIQLLLHHPKIDINADFDDYYNKEEGDEQTPKPITALDVARKMTSAGGTSGGTTQQKKEEERDRFDLTHDLLVQYGAKLYRDL